MAVEVESIKELKKAVRDREEDILIINRDLAKKVSEFKEIENLTKDKIVDAITGYLSGQERDRIVAIVSLGVSEAFGLHHEYQAPPREKKGASIDMKAGYHLERVSREPEVS